MKTLKKLLARVPKPVQVEAKHVALTFAAAFVAAAGPLLPTLLGSPKFSTAKALLVAAIAAGVKAAIPALRAGAQKLLAGLFTKKAA